MVVGMSMCKVTGAAPAIFVVFVPASAGDNNGFMAWCDTVHAVQYFVCLYNLVDIQLCMIR